jgi:hypothetical protein
LNFAGGGIRRQAGDQIARLAHHADDHGVAGIGGNRRGGRRAQKADKADPEKDGPTRGERGKGIDHGWFAGAWTTSRAGGAAFELSLPLRARGGKGRKNCIFYFPLVQKSLFL